MSHDEQLENHFLFLCFAFYVGLTQEPFTEEVTNKTDSS